MAINPLNDISRVYLEQVVESAVPGKPAERLGAVTAIPQKERDAARERLLAKTKAKREKMRTDISNSYKPEGELVDEATPGRGGGSGAHPRKAMSKPQNPEIKEKKPYISLSARKRAAGLPEEAKPNDGNLANNYPPFDKVTRGDVIAGATGKDQMGGKKKKKLKEGLSNWRQDLSEVMDDVVANKEVKEKKVNNKIKTSAMGGGIKLGESIENLGGELVEMVEIDGVLDEITDIELTLLSDDLIEEVVEEFFYECLEEGYEVDEIEDMLIESIETSAAILNEAKVTLGHDTKIERKSDRLQKVKSAVKKVARGVGYAAGAVVRGAKAIGREVKAGYAAGKESDSGSSSGTRKSQTYRNTHQQEKRPGLLSRLGSKLKSGLKKAVASGARAVSRGARDVARKMDGGGSSPTPKSTPAPVAKKPTEKPADPWEGSSTTPPKAKAKPAAKPKAKKKTGKLDSLLSSIRNEEVELDEAEGSYGQTPKADAAYTALATGKGKSKTKSLALKHAIRSAADRYNSDKPYSHRSKMTQSDRDYHRGQSENSGKDREGIDFDEFDTGASGPGGKPKGKKLERQRKTGVSAESFNIDERALDATETKEKERIFKAIKPSKLAKSYPEKSPKEIKSLRYAISTKSAKRNMDTSVSDRRYGVEEAMMPGSEVEDQNKNNVTSIADKQKLANLKAMEQKQRQLRLQRFNLQKQGKLPLDTN